jgi:DNA-binding NarL/FixJ family response regulator
MVVDDAAEFRDGVVTILSSAADLEVVAEAQDGVEALAVVAQARPDVALVDLKMPNLDGVGLTRRLRVVAPACRIVVLTTFDQDNMVFEALRAGAVGYLLKDLSAERLLDAVRRAAEGGSVLNDIVASKVIAEFARMKPIEHAPPPAFSKRELEVLALLSRGATNKEIAQSLFLAEGTVKNHVTNILGKLCVSDRTQAALRARDLGIL